MKDNRAMSRLWALALLVAVLLAVFRAGPILDHLSLSLLSNMVLHEGLGTGQLSEMSQPFGTHKIERSPFCPAALAKINSESVKGMVDASGRRLMRYISLACEDDEQISARFDSEVANGYVPNAADALYIGQALARQGNADRALRLQQTKPIVSLWYVNLGRLAIEEMKNETAALAYFQLVDSIDPSYSPEKAAMYMYLCFASVRDRKTYILSQPCEDFDRAGQTSTSRLYLGREAYNRGSFAQALAYLTDAINLKDVSGDAYYWKGKTLVALGNTAEAQQTYEAGIIQAPTFPWNYLDLAELERDNGCYSAAREYLTRVQTLNIPESTSAAQNVLQSMDLQRRDNPGCP